MYERLFIDLSILHYTPLVDRVKRSSVVKMTTERILRVARTLGQERYAGCLLVFLRGVTYGAIANTDRDKGKSDVQAWSYILHFAT
jgi:hypothetical protein